MRRLIAIILSLIIPVSMLPAVVDVAFAPYAGAVNLNLNSKWTTFRDPDDGLTGGSESQIFDAGQVVAHGEIDNIRQNIFFIISYPNEARDIQIRISFNSDSAFYHDGSFWFVSQSNPDSIRPFQIQIAGHINRTDEAGFIAPGTKDGWVSFSDRIEKAGEVIIDLDDYTVPIAVYGEYVYSVDFDFGIYFPGEIENGTLEYEGKTYTIMPGDDYSSEIEVTVEIGSTGREIEANPQILSFVIPFSGYYDPTMEAGQELSTDVSSALSVNVLPGAATIDLINDQGKTIDIAEIDYGIYNLNASYDQAGEDVLLFLSSNPNPFVGDPDGFRFIHEEALNNPSVIIGDTNSLGYKITSVFSPGEQEVVANRPEDVTYDGTAWIDIGDTSTDGVLSNGENAIKTVHHDMAFDPETASIPNPHWHTYRGILQLKLDPLKSSIDAMQPGYYRSTVYVHVVVDENLYANGRL